MTPDVERAAAQYALTQGWLTPERLREALLLREHLRATGRPAELVPLLVARFLRPEHAREMERRLLAASSPAQPGPAPAVLPQDLDRSVDLSRRPAEQDPAAVQQFLQSLPGLAQMAGRNTVSIAPGRPSGSEAPRPVLPPPPRQMPSKLGPYEIERELARGGMGAVYVARHPQLDRQVALKVVLGLDPGRLKRFEVEARTTARLRHPNIVALHEVGEDAGVRFIVMDLIQGESLKDKVEREGPLPPETAARVAEKIARALDYAHHQGVLHRDMKPSNVLLDREGEPLVTDFGLAKEAEGQDRLTVTGQLIGTPVYMPPEQATGARDRIDARSDVYSIGATLYEMLTGGPPFHGEQLMNIVVAVVREAPEPPSRRRKGLDPALDAIVLRCLAKAPEDRYQTAVELADALARWAGGRTRADSETVAAAGRRGGLRAAVPLLLLAAALGGVGTWLGLELRAVRRARDAQARGLVLLEDPAAREQAEQELRLALSLDPALTRARLALASLLVERGPAGLDDAAALLAPLRPDELRGPDHALLGRVAEARGQQADALQAYERAARAARTPDALEPDLARRLALARARDRAARGQAEGAEAALWDALRAAPLDAGPLVEVARARLAGEDVAGLARLWEEVHRRLGGPGQPDLQRRTRSEHAAVARALRDPAAPPAERVRAAVAGAALLRADVTDALREVAATETAGPLLREAAHAGLLAQTAATGPPPAARRAAFGGWCAQAAAQDEHEGALAGITLLEQAPWLRAEDRDGLDKLVRARGPLLRAALALALAVAGTREEGLPLDDARALLVGLARDADARVQEASAVATGALEALSPRGAGAAVAPALTARAALLARRLALLPGLARALEAPGHRPALERALAAGPTPALWLASAWDAAEAGDHDATRRALDACLALDPALAPALELRAQLDVLEGTPSPEDPLAGASDPEAARASRQRLAFTRRFGLPALPGPAGAVRVVACFRAGWSQRDLQDGLVLHVSDDLRVDAEGWHTKRANSTRTRFGFSAWHGVVVDHGPVGDKFGLWLSTSSDGGRRRDGLCVATHTGRGDLSVAMDEDRVAFPSSDRPCRERTEAVWTRPAVSAFHDGRALGRVHVGAREMPSDGAAFIDHGWGGGRLTRYLFEGVWAPEDDRGPPPGAARRRAFEQSLVSLDPATPVLAGNAQRPSPRDMAALRIGTHMLSAVGRWLIDHERGQTLYVPELSGDVEVRARLVFPSSGTCSAGLFFRPARTHEDVVWFGPGDRPENTNVILSVQRDRGWTHYLRRRAWQSDRPVRLVMQRLGDWLFTRWGPDGGELEDHGPPLYYPMDGPIDVGVYAQNYDEREPYVAARFDGIDILIAR